jgi:hypothetical protein
MAGLRTDRHAARSARRDEQAIADEIDEAIDELGTAALEARLVSDLNSVASALRRSAYAPPVSGPLRRPRVAPPQLSANDDLPEAWVFSEPAFAVRRAPPKRRGRRWALRGAVALVAVLLVLPGREVGDPARRDGAGAGPVSAGIVAPAAKPAIAPDLPDDDALALEPDTVPGEGEDQSFAVTEGLPPDDALGGGEAAADLDLAPLVDPSDQSVPREEWPAMAPVPVPETSPVLAGASPPPVALARIVAPPARRAPPDTMPADPAAAATDTGETRAFAPIVVPWAVTTADEDAALPAAQSGSPGSDEESGQPPSEQAALVAPSGPSPQSDEPDVEAAADNEADNAEMGSPVAGDSEADGSSAASAGNETGKAAAEADETPPPAPTDTRKIRLAVNMRAKPDNDANIVTVIPAGKAFAVIGCKAWCEVSFNGKRGFVYKDLIEGKAKSAARRHAAGEARAKAPVEKARPCKPGLAASAFALVRKGFGDGEARPEC